MRVSKGWSAATLLVIAVFTSSETFAQTAVTFREPAPGSRISQTFNSTGGAQSGSYHAGVDYSPPRNLPATYSKQIVAAAPGVVALIVKNGSSDHALGNTVILQHRVPISSTNQTQVFYTQYSHLASFQSGLKVGKVVSAGEALAAR